MPTLNQLREDFAKAHSDAEKIRQKYNGTPETMTPNEMNEWESALDVAAGIKAQIMTLEKHEEIESWATKVNEKDRPVYGSSLKSVQIAKAESLHSAAYRRYLSGQPEMNHGGWMKSKEYNEWDSSAEVKAYQADNPAGGGFAIMPQVLMNEFITLMKDLVYLRNLAKVIPVNNADTLGVPALDTDPSDSDWTAELNVGNEETTAGLGKREFRPSPVAKFVKLSKKLLRQAPAFETLILERLAYKMAITEEKAFLTGTGANQPLGVFTASSNGISTSRDKTAANATSVVADDFFDAFWNLKAQYRARSTWIMHRDLVKAVRKLKDTTNNYLWSEGYGGQTGVVTGPGGGMQGTPGTLMGRPVLESEYAPNTLTTGLYVAIVGDFSNFWIADALNMEIQTLYELYAGTNQMGYIMRRETDGMPVLEEAFSRLKLA